MPSGLDSSTDMTIGSAEWIRLIDRQDSLDKVISTKYVYKAVDVSKTLTPEQLAQGTIPYKDDPNEDDSLDVGVAMLFSFVLQANGLEIPVSPEIATKSLPMIWWTYALCTLLIHPEAITFPCPNRDDLQVIAYRLAHTHPKTLRGHNKALKQFTNPDRNSKAMWACACTLGTLYQSSSKSTPKPGTITNHFAKLPPNAIQPKAPGTPKATWADIAKANAASQTAATPGTGHSKSASATVTPGPPASQPKPPDSVVNPYATKPAAKPTPEPAAQPATTPATQTAGTAGVPPGATKPAGDPVTQTGYYTLVQKKANQLKKKMTPMTPGFRHKLRLKFKIIIPPKENVTKEERDLGAMGYFLSHLDAMCENYFSEEPNGDIVILPWKIGATESPVTCMNDMPRTRTGLDHYCNRLRNPAWGSYAKQEDEQAWFNMQWAYKQTADTFPFNGTYKNWFKDHGHGAYPCTVQDSDDEVNLGNMRFGGDFADNSRLAEEFYQSYRGSQTVDGDIFGRLLVGFKPALNKEFGKPGTISREPFPNTNRSACTVYRVNPWRTLQVFAHKQHAGLIKDMLVRKFNRVPNFLDRPGNYDFIFMAGQERMNAGWHKVPSQDSTKMSRLRNKHLHIAGNLVVLTTTLLHQLDSPVRVDTAPTALYDVAYLKHELQMPPITYPGMVTARRILLSIPFPLPNGPSPEDLHASGRTAPNRSDRMFHSVDMSHDGKCKLVCYATRVPVASHLIAAFPAYFHRFYGEAAFAEFVPYGAIMDPKQYTFRIQGGKWTGEWDSAEDQQLDDDLNYGDLPPDSYLLSGMEIVHATAAAGIEGDNNLAAFQRPTYALEMHNTDEATVGQLTTSSGHKQRNDGALDSRSSLGHDWNGH